jgi:hypothetical protein
MNEERRHLRRLDREQYAANSDVGCHSSGKWLVSLCHLVDISLFQQWCSMGLELRDVVGFVIEP